MFTSTFIKPAHPLLRFLFFLLVIRPLVLIIIGLHLKKWAPLPKDGPALIVANHNSHLDTLVLMSLFPLRQLPKIRPVAAADYFLKTPLRTWFSLHILGIIPLSRSPLALRTKGEDLFSPIHEALKHSQIVIYYPEGTRGEPEQMLSFKSGIARLAEKNPKVPIYPVFMHGLGKALPKGEALLVPFFCDVGISEPLFWDGARNTFIEQLEYQIKKIGAEFHSQGWN